MRDVLNIRWSRRRVALAASLSIAALATAWSLFSVTIFPPGLARRPTLEMAAASTHAIVDTPRSTLVGGTPEFSALNSRAILLGNVMASAAVRDYVARRTGAPRDVVKIVPPLTPDAPRPLVESGDAKHASDLLRSTKQYRLNIQLDPESSILDVYSQAPDVAAAEHLANGAVAGLRDYLSILRAWQGPTAGYGIRITQLGRARGGIINQGIGWQVALVTFLAVFALSWLVINLITRLRLRWMRPQGRTGPRADGDELAALP